MNKLTKRLLIIGILLLIAALIIYPKLDFSDKKQPTPASGEKNAKQEGGKLPVNAVIVNAKTISDIIKIVGSVVANESLELRSEISGKVTGIYFEEGQRIPKGKLLLRLDATEMQAEIEKLRYNKKLLEEREYRERMLLERDAVSQEEYDQTKTELNKAKADIKLEEAKIRKSRIIAPFDGIIGLRYVSLGSYVMPTDELASLYNIDPAKIEFSVPEKYSDQVTVGDTIIFQTEASEEEFRGVVYVIEPRIDPQTRTLKMRAKSPNKDSKLLPGMFVRIELMLSAAEQAIMVPTEAVIPELGGHKVYVYRNSTVKEQAVRIGERTSREIQIVEGLRKGDTLITSGILQLRPGMGVQLKIK